MKVRIIKDIRFYESNWENISGNSHPGEIGKIYDFGNVSITSIGQVIARKLNENKFNYKSFDHIYVNFTTILDEDEIEVSERNTEKRLKYINYGLNPNRFNIKSDTEKEEFVYNVTFQILKEISKNDTISYELVNETEKIIREFKTETMIKYKFKQTKSYSVQICYQIKPNNKESCFILNYIDTDGIKGSYKYGLKFYDDIYPLIDSIAVKKGVIILNPKKSFRADLYNERYKTPIKIKLNELVKDKIMDS